MNKRNRSIFVSVIAIIALACACPGTALPGTNQPPATFAPISTIPPIVPTEEVAPPPSADALLADDFSVDTGEWETFSDDAEGSTEIASGVYAITTLANLWIWGRSDTEFTDTVAEFDVTLISGPSNNFAGVGLYCRLTLREDTSADAYLLAIGADGYYAILEFTAGAPTPLVDWAFSDVINQGTSTNNIRATCDGNQLILEVNGEILASTSISAGGATSGYLAFATVSFEDADPVAVAHFDNLVVTAP